MAWAGIDPGKDGAVALILASGVIKFWDTPTLPSAKKNSKARLYYSAEMARIVLSIQALYPQVRWAVEKLHSRPGQSSVSTFSQGFGCGLWEGILATSEASWVEVTPQAWKKSVLQGFSLKDKGAAVAVASRQFPSVASELKTVRGRILDGRADALCIAEWLRRRGTLAEILK